MSPDQSPSAVTWLGEPQPGGTYLLRLRVHHPLFVQFGRFQNGRPFSIPPADYLYIGSARGRRGSASLAHRLLRHASRSYPQPAQPIRAHLLDLFTQSEPINPPRQKTCHWHIDYLLERLEVELVQIIIIYSAERLEKVIGHWLLTAQETAVVAPGLGATDIRGSTHLLRVPPENRWWHNVISHLRQQFLDE